MATIHSLSFAHLYQNADTSAETQPPAETSSCCDLYAWGVRLFEDWTYTLLVGSSLLAVTGLVLSILSGSLFFSISFAILAMASFYAAKEIKLLGDMITQVNRLKTLNQDLENQVQGLQTINTNLNEQVVSFNTENTQFKESNEALGAQIKIYQKSSTAITNQLEELVQKVGSENEESKKVVSHTIDRVQEENAKAANLLTQAAANYSEKFAQLEGLIKDWQKPGATAENLTQLIKIQGEVGEATQRLTKILTQIEDKQEALSELKGQVASMKTQVQKFSDQNSRLSETANKLHQAANLLSPSTNRNSPSFAINEKTSKRSRLEINGNDANV